VLDWLGGVLTIFVQCAMADGRLGQLIDPTTNGGKEQNNSDGNWLEIALLRTF
jgi:hypothetical protein